MGRRCTARLLLTAHQLWQAERQLAGSGSCALMLGGSAPDLVSNSTSDGRVTAQPRCAGLREAAFPLPGVMAQQARWQPPGILPGTSRWQHEGVQARGGACELSAWHALQLRLLNTDTGSQHKQQQQQEQQEQPEGRDTAKPPGASLYTLPNLLSLSRVASAPAIAYLITQQHWEPALALLALAGVTDWLDGYLARRLGHTSKLGSYLDPLADKVLIVTVAVTLGAMQLLPAWLAALVAARDAAQVAALAWYRYQMFGGRWPGAARFFDVDADVGGSDGGGSSSGAGGGGGGGAAAPAPGPGAGIDEAEEAGGAEAAGALAGCSAPMGLPTMRPHIVSKANTALVLVLIGGCISHAWLGAPPAELLAGLEWGAAATTGASGAIYVQQYLSGKLLPPRPRQR